MPQQQLDSLFKPQAAPAGNGRDTNEIMSTAQSILTERNREGDFSQMLGGPCISSSEAARENSILKNLSAFPDGRKSAHSICQLGDKLTLH